MAIIACYICQAFSPSACSLGAACACPLCVVRKNLRIGFQRGSRFGLLGSVKSGENKTTGER